MLASSAHVQNLYICIQARIYRIYIRSHHACFYTTVVFSRADKLIDRHTSAYAALLSTFHSIKLR